MLQLCGGIAASTDFGISQTVPRVRHVASLAWMSFSVPLMKRSWNGCESASLEPSPQRTLSADGHHQLRGCVNSTESPWGPREGVSMEKQDGLSSLGASVLQQGPRPLHHTRPCWIRVPWGTQKPGRYAGDDESQAPSSTPRDVDHLGFRAEPQRGCLFLAGIGHTETSGPEWGMCQ